MSRYDSLDLIKHTLGINHRLQHTRNYLASMEALAAMASADLAVQEEWEGESSRQIEETLKTFPPSETSDLQIVAGNLLIS